MATQTFTTPITFNRKNAKNLYDALQNDKDPKLEDVKFETVKGKTELENFFGKKVKDEV